MELGESASVDVIVDEKHDDETCVFCQADKPPEEIVNDFEAEPDGDEEAETGDDMPSYKFKNNAGKLGKNMGGKPEPKKVPIKGKDYNAAVAAHHLIPGNASLKNSELFLSEEYLWKEGKAKGNIGYNINSEANGVWSPGNYGVRPWGTQGATFATKSKAKPEDFAFEAMQKWRTQFHDAHSDYSDFVLKALNKLYEKLEAGNDIWCSEAKKKEEKPDEKDPLYVLVNRLNTISARMKKMLVFPTTNWKPNIYTSRFVEMYVKETKKHQD